ncbi:MAG: aryl-sulfate sulfotransferase [Reichenbachiella sp.]|uniref:aryl-sulfate sulfotransferase n=1 Tax=Reichenbachiella sp. TaxID=2184521 RepID=UPI0032992478
MLTFIKHTPFLAWLVLGYWLSSCQSETIQFTTDPVALPDSTNELRMKVSFDLNQEAEAYVAFWVKDKPDQKYYSPLSPVGRSHYMSLVGLKGITTYEYQVIARNEKTENSSDIQTFTTEKFPINVLHLRWDEEKVAGLDGYILSQRRMVNGIIYLIDQDGDVVWYQSVPKQPKLSHWTDKDRVLVLYGAAKHRNSSGDQIVEYDLLGNELFHLDLSKLNEPLEAHHEVRYNEEGNLLALVYEFQKHDLSKVGGSPDQQVMGDKIVKMDTTGQVLWSWSIFDYLNPALDSTILKTAEDWSHANSLSIDQDGNYLISFRNFNQVWKIDAQSGDVFWKLGEGGNIAVDSSGYFYGQHAFHINPEGSYQVFDNGRKERQTRIVTYQIEESNKTADIKKIIELPEDLYCDKMGSAYLMNNDNLLICAPRTNSLVVVNPAGEVLSRARVGIPDPYRAEYVPQLYDLSHVR